MSLFDNREGYIAKQEDAKKQDEIQAKQKKYMDELRDIIRKGDYSGFVDKINLSEGQGFVKQKYNDIGRSIYNNIIFLNRGNQNSFGDCSHLGDYLNMLKILIFDKYTGSSLPFIPDSKFRPLIPCLLQGSSTPVVDQEIINDINKARAQVKYSNSSVGRTFSNLGRTLRSSSYGGGKRAKAGKTRTRRIRTRRIRRIRTRRIKRRHSFTRKK